MVKKFKLLYSRIIYVSKLTGVRLKKLRILLSIFLSNASVGLEIIIVVTFTTLITNQISFNNQFIVKIIETFVNNKYSLPFLIFLRYIFLFFEKLNIESLSLKIQENLRQYIMSDIFEKGNMSTSDSYFYINQVCAHVSYFYRSLSIFVNAVMQALAYSIFLSFYNFEIFSSFVAGAFFVVLPSRFLMRKSKYYQHLSFTQAKGVDSLIQRIIDNSFLIKILKTKKFELGNFKKNLSSFTIYEQRNVIYRTLNSVLPSFFALFILSIIFSFFKIARIISIEFIAILLRLFQNLSTFTNSLNLVLNSSVHLEELFKLDKSSQILNLNNYVIKQNLEHAIKFENVNFKYFNAEELIIENLNLEFPKNKHTIITGPNGSGKSTILGLISGLYLPESGFVSMSSHKLGYVGVTPLVFDGSLKDNLLYGNKNSIDDEKIIELINKFSFYPEKQNFNLNDKISNRTLSSGQLQKISFMRSILNDSDILLLDEATSNLDSETKKLVFDILSEQNLTIINSTHNKTDFKYDYELNIFTSKNRKIFNFS